MKKRILSLLLALVLAVSLLPASVFAVEDTPLLQSLSFESSTIGDEYTLSPAFGLSSTNEYTVAISDSFPWDFSSGGPDTTTYLLGTMATGCTITTSYNGKEETYTQSDLDMGIALNNFVGSDLKCNMLKITVSKSGTEKSETYTVTAKLVPTLKNLVLTNADGMKTYALSKALAAKTYGGYEAYIPYSGATVKAATTTASTINEGKTPTVQVKVNGTEAKWSTDSDCPYSSTLDASKLWMGNAGSRKFTLNVETGSNDATKNVLPAKYEVTCYELPSKLEITKMPTKIEYRVGDDLDTTGMEVTAYYGANGTEPVKVDPNDLTIGTSKVIDKDVTVSYRGVTTTLTLDVTPFEGKGTQKDPYKLSTPDDLQRLSDVVASGVTYEGKHFKITSDITLPADWQPIGRLKDGKTWEPMLSASTGDNSDYWIFKGNIDGTKENGGCYTITVRKGSQTMLGAISNCTISNINIKGEQINGYGVVDYYCRGTTDITLENITLKSGSHTKYAGFIGGYASGVNNVYIRNCTVEEGVVIGDDGTVPAWKEELEKTYRYEWGPSNVQYNDMIGSFAGAFNGIIENCTSAAKVYGRNYVGGIVGFKGQSMGDCITRNCTFTGEVIASGKFVGGIMGGGYSTISAPNTPAATVESCAFTGKVTGATCVGGIFGGEELLVQCWNNGIGYIRSNYSNGIINATDADGIKGGVIGYMHSLNRYTVVSGNYYRNATADKGIGAVKYVDTDRFENLTEKDGTTYFNTAKMKQNKQDPYTLYLYANDGKLVKGLTVAGCGWKTDLNRTDDPLGADAGKLAASFTDTELASGAVTEKLNAVPAGQGWTGVTPTHTTVNHVVDLRSAELNCNPESTVTQKDGLNMETPVTVNYSDGTTKVISLKDCTITGLNLTKSGYQLCSANYAGYSLVFGVKVSASVADGGDTKTDGGTTPTPTPTPATGDTGVLVWVIALPTAALAAAFVLKRKERRA